MNKNLILYIVLNVLVFYGCQPDTGKYTRGVGIYPGRPSEDFSPELVPGKAYRNIAYLRPVYQSSSYDYNLTSQLLTDGIISEEMPAFIRLRSNDDEVPKNEREWLLDSKPVSVMTLNGTEAVIQFELGGGLPDSIDKIIITGSIEFIEKKPRGWTFTCSGSDDGVEWTELKKEKGYGLPGAEPPEPELTRMVNTEFAFSEPAGFRIYRVSFSAPCVERWSFSALDFFSRGKKLNMLPSRTFNSSWMSAGNSEEWVYVDLGPECEFDRIRLHWLNKAVSGTVMISDNAQSWKEIVNLPGGNNPVDDITMGKELKAKGRHLKILMEKSASGGNYVLSEIEVYGSGGLIPKPKPIPDEENGIIRLSGGEWKIQRASLTDAAGDEISTPGFHCSDWITATVPGTVLSSYKNAGALPDPNFDDNQLIISESFFNSDFWYRDEFNVPPDYAGKQIWLNFDGINWKADVFVNGSQAGRIEGAFVRGKFNVTELIKPGERNGIAVLIHKNDNIGAVKEQTALSTDKNGGILGADNPTFHASVGWDWIPTIRGRNTGIWNDVYLGTTGPVIIEDPLVLTDLPLPDTLFADISIQVKLINAGRETVTGQLSGNFGQISFSEEVTLAPSETRSVKLDPSRHPELHLENPRLWWPNGYGVPYLYDFSLSFITSEGISDKAAFKTGIREMSFNEDNMTLNMFINGRRFIGRGGNWGFSESNLSYREREYDAAIGYHADMNFTMIRNWVGQTADEEFFEACDRHGIMVWQDFCLANPADGPDPYDPAMFLSNADDIIKRIRNHPSVAIYVGRNEGNPPAVIDTALRRMIKNLHPGLHYIPNSAMGVVSGGGPYRALPVRDYYLLYGNNKFHSERGMPNVMSYESLMQTLKKDYLWPQNSHWGMHDYTLESAQSCASFNGMVEKAFGPVKSAREFTELSQWINYNGYRGMFEGRSRYRQGLLLWMSHPAWPSMVWQTYDYYLDPTAAYFGCKKASEPIHIQWNPVFDNVEVVNYNAGDQTGLEAKARVYSMDGTLQWEKTSALDCREDSTVTCFKVLFPQPISKVHFIWLELRRNGETLSRNFYWRSSEDGNFQSLRSLPRVNIGYNTKAKRTREGWVLTTTITNATDLPALMIRLKVVGNESGERLLPVIYSDNYISLMPGEQRIVTMKLKEEDTRGERPEVEISGFNLN